MASSYYGYDPSRYVPDMSWLVNAGAQVAKAVAGVGQEYTQLRANEDDVENAYNQAKESFKVLGQTSLGLSEEDAEKFANRQVRKPTNADKKDPVQYIKDAANLTLQFDEYQQDLDFTKKFRQENPNMPPMKPPPMPSWGLSNEQYQTRKQKWAVRDFAAYMSKVNKGSAQGQQLQTTPGQQGTGAAAPPPPEAPTPGAAAPPTGGTPGSALEVPAAGTPQTTTPAPTGAPAPAPAPGQPGVQAPQGLMLPPGYQGAIGAAGATGDPELLKLTVDLAKTAQGAINSSQATMSALAKQFGVGFEPGTQVTAQQLASGEFEVPLGGRQSTEHVSYSRGGSGIPEELRYEQNITNIRRNIRDSIDDMTQFTRSSDRMTHMDNIMGQIEDLVRNLRAVNTPEDDIRRQVNSWIATLRKIDPNTVSQYFTEQGKKTETSTKPGSGYAR